MDLNTFKNKHENKDNLAQLSLALVPGIGPKTFQKILLCELSAEQIYLLEADDFKKLGISKKSIEHIKAHPPNLPSRELEACLDWAQHKNHHVVLLSDEHYPHALRQINTAPPFLMVKGNLDVLALPQLAVVGSRYPTAAGQQQAYEFSQALANMGLVITSGLAKGIDACAHNGALSVGAKTIAVMGTGMDHIYPSQHCELSEKIIEQGALISEFPLHSKAMPGHFPRRNRIVSGLSLGTLVVEATLKSGSLITARQALEQNREVFAIPGPLQNPQKSGCHHLIRQGAILVENPMQIVDELKFIQSKQQTHSIKAAEKYRNLSNEQSRLAKVMDYEGASLDELIHRSNMPVAQLNVLLMDMELSGLIRQEHGEYALI